MSPPSDPIIQQLISTEAHVHYSEPPPPGIPAVEPFVCVARDSRILISAPHGTRAFRNSAKEAWHEEDEYTASMALLLGERCGVSVIANVWRSDKCDPNYQVEDQCAYKREMRKLVETQNIRWVLDLHGAAKNSKPMGESIVDLGTRSEDAPSMGIQHRDKLRDVIVTSFGKGSVSLNGWAASWHGTVTAFCQELKKVQAVQIEMKPSVRIPVRRVDASSYATDGPYSAPPEKVIAMLTALEAFIIYLKQLPQP